MDGCICGHPAEQHELEGGDVPVILQAAICRVDDCTCDDWDAVEPFPGRPPIRVAVVGTNEDGNITVEAAEVSAMDTQRRSRRMNDANPSDEGGMGGMEHDDWPEGTVMGGEDDFTPWEGDLTLTPSCGECGALVANVEAHRRYHEELSQHVLKAIREAQRRRGLPPSEQIR